MKLIGQLNNPGYVYIMTNHNKTTLYIGVTSELLNRVIQHKNNTYPKSFTAKYNLKYLVYYKYFESIGAAIDEEKRLKGGSRKQKLDLINAMNPEWRDLFEDLIKQ